MSGIKTALLSLVTATIYIGSANAGSYDPYGSFSDISNRQVLSCTDKVIEILRNGEQLTGPIISTECEGIDTSTADDLLNDTPRVSFQDESYVLIEWIKHYYHIIIEEGGYGYGFHGDGRVNPIVLYPSKKICKSVK